MTQPDAIALLGTGLLEATITRDLRDSDYSALFEVVDPADTPSPH